ncbi:hypothetical protein [Caulobacter sp. X]|uniref:hypothetical protein n=1 Tax=Caulobacter sp. X TaxID=2048901 RepID=UPI00117771F9|nr:hypothetical protein [Caulobacter sp. X]
MAISGDYPTPVNVNGFSCKNCTDVDNAKKHIDPAHPKDGPYGINAENRNGGDRGKIAASSLDTTYDSQKAVVLGGRLSALVDRPATVPAARAAAGHRLDLAV